MASIKVRYTEPYRVDGDDMTLVERIGFAAAQAAVPGSQDHPASADQ